jgi:hypothetical protein
VLRKVELRSSASYTSEIVLKVGGSCHCEEPQADLGDVAGKFEVGLGTKLLPISRLLAATPVAGTLLSLGEEMRPARLVRRVVRQAGVVLVHRWSDSGRSLWNNSRPNRAVT